MPKTYAGFDQDTNDAINQVGYEAFNTTEANASYALNFNHFFSEEDFSAMCETGVFQALDPGKGRIFDIPLSTTLLYMMGKYGTSIQQMMNMVRDNPWELRKMGHEMLQDLQEHPIQVDGEDVNYQNFVKTILEGVDRYLDEPFPNIDFHDLNHVIPNDKRKICTLERIGMSLEGNIFSNLSKVKNAGTLLKAVGAQKINQLQAENEAVHMNLSGLNFAFFSDNKFTPDLYINFASRRYIIQNHAKTFENMAQGRLRDVSSLPENERYLGFVLTQQIPTTFGVFARENNIDLTPTEETVINPAYPHTITSMDLSPLEDIEVDLSEGMDLAKTYYSNVITSAAARTLQSDGINHSTYDDLLEHHRFDTVFDEHGLPHSMDYLETLDANQKFYMAPDGEIQEFQLVTSDEGQVTVQQTNAKPKSVEYKDMDQIRATVDDMAKALKDADPRTLLTGSKQFKELRQSMADLQNSLQNPDAPDSNWSEKLKDTLDKAQEYLGYRSVGEGKNKNMSDIAKARISAATSCAHGLDSLIKMGVTEERVRDISNETKALSHISQYVMDARIINGDSHAQMTINATNQLKALTLMSPEQRNQALKNMFITQKQKVDYAMSLPEEQRKTDPRLEEPTLADQISLITTARTYEKKFPDVRKGLPGDAFKMAIGDKETRKMISNFIGTKFKSDIEKGNFSSIVDLMADEKSMDKLLMDAIEMKKNPMVAQASAKTMEKTKEMPQDGLGI